MGITARAASLSLVSSLVIAGCGSLQEGASKLVAIEFDQEMNFDHYTFDNYPDPAEAGVPWKDIRIQYEWQAGDALGGSGVWILYELCYVSNTGSKAKDFDVDIERFYVEYGGNKNYAVDLKPYEYVEANLNDYYATPAVNDILKDRFRTETQLQSVSTVAAGTVDTSRRRFVIQVHAPATDTSDLLGLRLKLQYDIEDGVTISDRGYDPVAEHSSINADAFPAGCRPSQN